MGRRRKLDVTSEASRKTSAESMREYRRRLKASGYKYLSTMLPKEYLDDLNEACDQLGIPYGEFICYVLDEIREGRIFSEEVRLPLRQPEENDL